MSACLHVLKQCKRAAHKHADAMQLRMPVHDGMQRFVMQEVKKEVDNAVEEAKASPAPALAEMWTHVYKNPVGDVRNVEGDRVRLP